MAASRLCQELLTCIFEHVLAAGDVSGESTTTTQAQHEIVNSQLHSNNKPQRSELPTKRLRSASEQQTATHGTLGQSLAKKTVSAHGTLCLSSRVCRSWYTAATKLLYRDPGNAISRYEGLYLPHLLSSLRTDAFLRDCVRGFTVTASLEAGLWVSDYAGEGDLFCEFIELCPRIQREDV